MMKSIAVVVSVIFAAQLADGQSQLMVSSSSCFGGKIILSGDLVVKSGASQEYFIQPLPGFKIAKLELDNKTVPYKTIYGINGSYGAYTLSNIYANHILRTSFFKTNSNSVFSTAGPGGSISPSGEQKIKTNSSSEVYIIKANNGFGIKNVLVDNISVGPFTSSATFNYQFFNVSADHIIKAVFISLRKKNYKLDAAATTGGTISPNHVKTHYGDSATFILRPNPGFVITGLTDNQSSLGQLSNYEIYSYNVSNIIENHSIEAFFDSAYHTVSAVIQPAYNHGTVFPKKELVKYGGSSAVFTFNADSGYLIDKILLNGNPLTLQPKDSVLFQYSLQYVYTPATFQAYFIPSATRFIVTSKGGSKGTIFPKGPMEVKVGDSVRFSIQASVGYTISGIKIDDSLISQYFPKILTSYEYTFYNVHSNHILAATYQSIDTSFIVSATISGNGNISPIGISKVKYDDSIRFNITAAQGFRIQDVVIDGKSVANDFYELFTGTPLLQTSYTFYNVTGPHHIHISFSDNSRTFFHINRETTPEIGFIDGPELIDSGASQSYQVVARYPQFNVMLSCLLVDGYPVDPKGIYTFKKINQDHSLTADFELKPDCNFLDIYEVPRLSAVPSISKYFKHIYVITSGVQDDLGTAFVDWNAKTNHLKDFLIRPKNGGFVDLSNSTQSFSSAEPKITLASTNLRTVALINFRSLDNLYLPNIIGGNLILIAESGSCALVFSNDDEYIFDCAKTTTPLNSISNETFPAKSERIAGNIKLENAYPNPFGQLLNIQYLLEKPSLISLYISDVFGNIVGIVINSQLMNAGLHTIEYNASALPSGIYYYIIQSNQNKTTKKVVHIRN